MAGRLTHQTALVTGGSRGIGRAICRALDAEGAKLVVHYHQNRAAAEEVREMLQPRSAVVLLQADLASMDSISRMIDALADSSIDILSLIHI